MSFQINAQPLSFKKLIEIYSSKDKISIGSDAERNIKNCRSYLEGKIQEDGAQHYGVNTGFGSLCNVIISPSAIEDLQLNLIRSHAVGLGDAIPKELCRLIFLLKIINVSWGHSGVRMELLEKMCEIYNADIIPVMYTFGSLGASGDLAPLSHLSLVLVGEGEVYFQDEITDTKSVLENAQIEPIILKAKEGLALINGTQFTTGITAWCLSQIKHQWNVANLCAAVSSEVFDCRLSPFDKRLDHVRPHEGQRLAAEQIRNWRAESALSIQPKKHVQDPYSFRCAPQVHGASYQAIKHAEEILTTEINSITDNPIIFPESDGIISGGNFHAQPIALIADYLAIACSELASISERRLYQLVSGPRDLPDYLIRDAGINSGFMITQYTAASLVSRNKILCTPASIDSIVSSKGQEDHVSMGANAATKLKEIVANTWDVLAMEWLAAMQGIDLCKPVSSSEKLMALWTNFREEVHYLEKDRALRVDILKSKAFLKEISI